MYIHKQSVILYYCIKRNYILVERILILLKKHFKSIFSNMIQDEYCNVVFAETRSV